MNKDIQNKTSVICRYNDITYEIPGKEFSAMLIRVQYYGKCYVRYKEGAYMYSMSEREFFRLAHDAEAVIKRNIIALVDTVILDKFIEFYHE